MSGLRDRIGHAWRWLGERAGQAATRPVDYPDSQAPRVLLYAASVVGLGHLMRVVRVAHRLRHVDPRVDILLVTDHPELSRAHLGSDLATVKLPAYRFREGTFEDQPADLGLTRDQFHRMRVNLLLATAQSFRPHVFLMDTAPHGKRNELRPALRFLGRQRPACTRILQLRDIPFPPGTDGRQCHGLERLRAEGELYDRIFVAGHERFFDVCAEHTLTDGVASKIEYIGFVNADLNGAAPPAGALGRKPVSANDCRFDAMLERPAQRIVVGFGGGWESDQLGPMVLEAFDRLSRRDGVERQLFLFTGPEIGADVYEAMERRLAGRASAWIRRFSPRFPEALARCDLAVLQAGSSVYQILDSDKPLILYTRDFKTSEQQDRARRLARFPGITLIDQDWLASHDLSRLMDDLLTAPRAPRRTGFDFDGARRAADAIAAVLNRRDARRSGMK